MSQTNTNPVALTAAQTKAYNMAVDLYVLAHAKRNGGVKAKPVIIIPRFEEDTDGNWVPVESNGTRITSKEGLMYLRLGMPTINGLNVTVMKHNEFQEESKLNLFMNAFDLTIGSALPELTLVVQETLEVPETNSQGQFKGGWQKKLAGGNSNIECTFTGTHDGITYDEPAPIFRRVKLAPVGTANTLIAHTNTAEISKFASAAWAALNNPQAGITKPANIKAVADEAAKREEMETRLKALKKVKASQRTPEQKAEIEQLEEQLEELSAE